MPPSNEAAAAITRFPNHTLGQLMTHDEMIQLLRDNIQSNVTLERDGGDQVRAYLTAVNGEGEDAHCTFMDVMEGVERTLSVSEIVGIEVG
jgi:hypothetical protein